MITHIHFIINKTKKYQRLLVSLSLVLLLVGFIRSFHNEFKVGDNQGNLILKARWEADERANGFYQGIRNLTVNGRRITPDAIYRTTFKYNSQHEVNPYYSSPGRYQVIEMNLGEVQTVSFLQYHSPISGLLDVQLDGQVYTTLNAYDEGWEERLVTIDFPSKYGISRSNFIWYIAAALFMFVGYVFIRQGYYQRLTMHHLLIVGCSFLLIAGTLFVSYRYYGEAPVRLLNESYGKKRWLLALFSATSLISLVVFTWHQWAQNRRVFRFVLPVVTLAGVSYLCVAILENGYSNIVNILPGYLFWNWLMFLIVYGILITVTHSIRWSGIILVTMATALGIANGVMIELRITPIQLYHFFQLGEARSVAEQFSLSLTNDQVVGLMLGASLVCILLMQPKTGFIRFKKQRALRIAIGTMATVGMLLVGIPQIVKYGAANLDYWRMQSTYSKHGFLVALFNYEEAGKMVKPKHYNEKDVAKVMAQYPTKPSSSQQFPNIIIIQNESQADFSNLTDLKLSQDPLKYQHALNQKHPHGDLVVSVFGGGTANTEYEVLTSNALGAGMKGMFPFQQLFKEPHNSVVAFLEENGYESAAIHPYPKENYRREQVYQQLGFDVAYFNNGERIVHELVQPEYERGYMTDKSLFAGVRTLYERKSDKPLFTFVATMQGHGGYKQKDYPTDIALNMSRSSSLQERVYLTSLSKSDQAFKELTDYFQEFSEPTVIVMYGDHQPALSDEFYEQFMDEGDRARLHRTPFIIWANFELTKGSKTTFSPNFLVPYMLEVLADSEYALPIPPYYQFLSEVMQDTPVYTTWGYQLANGEYVDEVRTDFYEAYRQAEYQNVTQPTEFRPYYE
ncbi:LTA synthase family protein [Aerococcaceae bacterium NML210727]|nr:LTA synthase family protein [Aerococcaceae bacterium NML210727]MCW6654190.1 LTA synthase family protein [Aerococcaceae bacterium NML201296]